MYEVLGFFFPMNNAGDIISNTNASNIILQFVQKKSDPQKGMPQVGHLIPILTDIMSRFITIAADPNKRPVIKMTQ